MLLNHDACRYRQGPDLATLRANFRLHVINAAFFEDVAQAVQPSLMRGAIGVDQRAEVVYGIRFVFRESGQFLEFPVEDLEFARFVAKSYAFVDRLNDRGKLVFASCKSLFGQTFLGDVARNGVESHNVVFCSEQCYVLANDHLFVRPGRDGKLKIGGFLVFQDLP